MQKTFKTNLTEKDIDKMIKQLKNFDKLMDEAAKNIVNDLSNFGVKKMKNIYEQNSFESSTPMEFTVEGNDYEKTVSMIGEQALYEEFGTGTVGAMHPHPNKEQYGLNPYNSGKTIRPVTPEVNAKTGLPVGALYWTYTDGKGEKVYTQGIPAGKEGYDSLQATIKKAPSVIKKRTLEALEGVE